MRSNLRSKNIIKIIKFKLILQNAYPINSNTFY